MHLLSGGDSDDTNLDSVFRHLTFESFFEREEGGVDCVFKREVVVVPDRQRLSQKTNVGRRRV